MKSRKIYLLTLALTGALFLLSQGAAKYDNKASDKKILVVYYSATNNTKNTATIIAKETGGTLFQVEPVTPYSSSDLNWNNPSSRVSQEHDNQALRNIELKTTSVENWDSYDVVFIGYPIWWGIAAWPIDNFVKDNDFTGKKVIPFCTAYSSGIGNSDTLLKSMTNTGNWISGKRFGTRVSQSEIKSWLNSLNI